MNLFEENNWAEDLNPLIEKYKGQKHPLNYENTYQLMISVILSAQDSDANINKITPTFFAKFRIKSKSCGEILNMDICISKLNRNARFICRTSQVIITRNHC